MTKEIFKKPSMMQRKMGIDENGRNGLSTFFNNWHGETWKNSYEDTENRVAILLISAMLSGVGYGFAQMAEYENFNDRPPLPQEHVINIKSDTPISMATIYDQTQGNVAHFGYNGATHLGNYLAVKNQDTDLYTISRCHSTCAPLSADEVRQLNANFKQMADKNDTEYLDPRFFFPHKISLLTQPISSEELEETILHGNVSVVEDEAERHMESDLYNVDGFKQRLDSPYLDIDTDQTIALWREALNSPNNDTYTQDETGDKTYVWPRTESGEWDDAWLGENGFLNFLGALSLIYVGAGAFSIGAAREKTRQQVKPIKGLNMLKKPTK